MVAVGGVGVSKEKSPELTGTRLDSKSFDSKHLNIGIFSHYWPTFSQRR